MNCHIHDFALTSLGEQPIAQLAIEGGGKHAAFHVLGVRGRVQHKSDKLLLAFLELLLKLLDAEVLERLHDVIEEWEMGMLLVLLCPSVQVRRNLRCGDGGGVGRNFNLPTEERREEKNEQKQVACESGAHTHGT